MQNPDCDPLTIGGCEVNSRLFLGTGKYSADRIIPSVVAAAGAQVVTVALRRVDFDSPQDNILTSIPKDCILMPNTSGARNAVDKVPGLAAAVEGGAAVHYYSADAAANQPSMAGLSKKATSGATEKIMRRKNGERK